jgi:RNA polymerase sigma-70 factor (ECF subfamily)
MVERRRITNVLVVLRCQQGDEQAWRELVALWDRQLFYYVRRFIGEQEGAWQVLSEVWLKVVKGLDKLEEAESFPKWIYTITRRAMIDHVKSESLRRELLRRDGDAAEAAEEDQGRFQYELAEEVHHGLAQLPPDKREVLTLFFLQDLTIAEIGEVLGVKEGTVKSRLHYAKQALRDVLEKGR